LQKKYPEHKLISDIGSGINSKRKGFRSILEGVFKGTIEEVVVASKDRFSRFNFELFEWIFQEHNSILVSDSKEPSKTEEQELSEDLMSIVTIFSSRFYGRKRYKVLQENKNLSD
jgi:predicted site-specific integrase-resolvase